MLIKPMTTLVCLLLPILLGASMTATAQEDNVKNINSFTCKVIIRANDFDQDAAIAFMHGYLLGKSGKETFDSEKLGLASDTFIDTCLDNPNSIAIEVLAKIVK